MTENTQHRITIKIQESTEILNNYKDHDKRYHIPKTGMSVHTAGFNSGVHREQGKCKKRSSRIKKLKMKSTNCFTSASASQLPHRPVVPHTFYTGCMDNKSSLQVDGQSVTAC